jgi:DNA-directed RNA polymerase specialized sigma subunit
MSSEMIQLNASRAVEEVAIGAGARRDPRFDAREAQDRLLRRAIYLSPEDRVLFTSVFEKGLSPTEASHLVGLTTPTIRRRLRELGRHLNSPLFAYVLTHRGGWSPERRRIAELRFLQRRSLRETVRKSGISMHQVRRHSDAIQSQFEAFQP